MLKLNSRHQTVILAAALAVAPAASAQVCTTQARMQPALRDALANAAETLAAAVKANDVAKVRASTVAEYATDFSASEFLIRNTAPKLAGETLTVTNLFSLDATAHKSDAAGNAEFTCPLSGTTLEADFSIPSLPTGNYGFVMVEATGGPQPWLLAFLLRQDAGTWKMAGFYPHARTAAGHDGLWYWNQARTAAKAKQLWSSWLFYGEAYSLLRPVGFMQTSHLDKLEIEQRNATPPELSAGVSKDTPFVLKGLQGDEFHFTGLSTDRSDDGTRLNVILHLRANSATDQAAGRIRNEAAAAAFVAAHPDLRKNFNGIWVFAENDAQQPFVMTQHAMSQIP